MRLNVVENWKNQYEVKISHYVQGLPEIAEEVLKLEYVFTIVLSMYKYGKS